MTYPLKQKGTQSLTLYPSHFIPCKWCFTYFDLMLETWGHLVAGWDMVVRRIMWRVTEFWSFKASQKQRNRRIFVGKEKGPENLVCTIVDDVASCFSFLCQLGWIHINNFRKDWRTLCAFLFFSGMYYGCLLWWVGSFSLVYSFVFFIFFSYKKCELQKWQMTVLFLVSLMCVFFYVLYFDVLWCIHC